MCVCLYIDIDKFMCVCACVCVYIYKTYFPRISLICLISETTRDGLPLNLKPVSHRQGQCKDSVRTCHDQEFRSKNSFNS